MSKVTLISGANRGLGLAAVELFLNEGHQVILSCRRESDGQEAMEGLPHPDRLVFHPLDVSKEESVNGIFEWIDKEYGRLDVLVNNAAINPDAGNNAINADLDALRSTIDTNLIGPWRMVQAAIPLMKKNGYGRIVNVSSGLASLARMSGHAPIYSTSKTALNALTASLAADLLGENIKVNSISPGWCRTDMGGDDAPRTAEQGAKSIFWGAMLPDDGPSGGFFEDGVKVDW